MVGISVFRDSVAQYGRNPALLLPVAVSILQAFSSVLLSGLLVSMRTQYFNPGAILQNVAISFFYLIVSFIVGLVVIVGYSSMVARITAGRKSSFSDWSEGLRKYFLRLLALNLILGVLVAVVVGGIALVVFITSLASKQPLSTGVFSATALLPLYGLFAVLNGFLYCCFAAVTVDDSDLAASITRGLRALRRGGKPMLCLLAILYVVSEAAIYATNPSGTSSTSLPASLAARFSLLGIITTIVPAILTPIWYLVVFAIYRGVSPKLK